MDTATRYGLVRTASQAIARDDFDGRVGDRESVELAPKILGLAIVSIVPALFWTGLLYFAAPLFGLLLSGAMLAATGVVIALILGLAFSALALAR